MSRPWWGGYELEPDQEMGWRIGPFRLWILRTATEWRITSEPSGDPLDSHLEIMTSSTEPPGDLAESQRFGFASTTPHFELRPMCADRPIIVKSESPFLVPSEENATVFVSTPVWVQVLVGPRKDPLVDLPAYRPSDTWFGPSTREGELCYAARTGARLNLPNLPVRPHRAISVVKIRNRAKQALPLERVRLPLPHLALYGSEDGRLWTEQVTLEREDEGEMAKVSLSKGAPKQADGAKRISGPRVKPEKGLSLRSFGGLLGLAGGNRYE